jgi:tetratricopeptide (TPR) repeat protein
MKLKKTLVIAQIILLVSIVYAATSTEELEIKYGYTLIQGQDLTKPQEGPQPNVDERWRIDLNFSLASHDVIDYDGDDFFEIVAALSDNSVLLISSFGELEDLWSIGDVDKIGRVYDLVVVDYDNDMESEIVFSLGGARVTREYDPHGVDFDDNTVTQKEEILYRVTRNLGGLQIFKADGVREITVDLLDGVRTVGYLQTPSRIPFIIAGVGESTVYTINRKISYDEGARVWTNMDETEIIDDWDYVDLTELGCRDRCASHDQTYCGYDDSESPARCCCQKLAGSSLQDCIDTCDTSTDFCGYDDSVNPPRCCCRQTTGSITQWELVDEEIKNGTLQIYNHKGELKGEYNFMNLYEDPSEQDKNIRTLIAGDYNKDAKPDYIVGLDDGKIVAVNSSSNIGIGIISKLWETSVEGSVRSLDASKLVEDGEYKICVGTSRSFLYLLDNVGNLEWKSALDGSVTSCKFMDLEGDGTVEVVAVSRNRKIYVFDATTGYLNWKYSFNKPVYKIVTTDFDKDTLTDIVVSTDNGLICLEVTEYYVKKNRADALFTDAENLFEAGEYTEARIKIERAKNLYVEIGDQDNIPRCDILITKLDSELRTNKLREADMEYDKAITLYALNRFNESITYLERAGEIYKELNNKEGVNKVQSMIEKIGDEKILSKKLVGDGFYSKALAFKNFGNITLALGFIEQAKEVYEEIDYYNGSVKCDLLIKQIADDQFKIAKELNTIGRYEKAQGHALKALELYESVSHYDRISETQYLLNEINQSLNTPKVEPKKPTDYSRYILTVIAVIVIGFMIQFFLKKKKSVNFEAEQEKMQEPEWSAENIPEDIDDIEEL